MPPHPARWAVDRLRHMTAASSAPTMVDVAARAGVSHQTVSRVLNDAETVRPETREAVLRAIKELGYRRNQAARALVTRRSGLIGVIVDELRLYGPASTVSSVAEAARIAGYGITLDLLWDSTGTQLAAAIDHQLGEAVEAIVVVAAHGEIPERGAGRRLQVPVISLDGFPRQGMVSAGVDHRTGGELAARHLLELGHRRIAHIAGPPDWPQAKARHAGFLEVVGHGGGEPGPVSSGDWSPRSGFEACMRILTADPSTTAVFVANDQMAIGALSALARMERRVPEDVSVVGFDDIPEAAFCQPPLTTVRQDFAALGREAVRLLVGAIDGKRLRPRYVSPRLVTRQSSAGPHQPAPSSESRRPSPSTR